jgi:inactivated superfamily I helicase
MSNELGSVKLPPVSAEFIHELEQAFQVPVVEVGFDRDKALWDAACRHVITWIKTKAHVQLPDGRVDPVAQQRATVRYGS